MTTIALLAVVSLVGCMPISENEVKTAMDHLKQFGHMAENRTDHNTLVESLMNYQKFMGLNVTGELDKDTVALMKKPRCGNLDTITETSVLPKPTTKMVVRYTIKEYPLKKARVHYDREIQEAFDKWAEYTYFQFDSTRRQEDVTIVFKKGNHGDVPFDGQGGVAAHASAKNMNIHFDSEEYWSEDDNGTNLQQIAAHEIGHLLGLGHSSNPDAVMYMTATYKPNFRLHPDDIRRVQDLFEITNSPKIEKMSSQLLTDLLEFDTIFRMNDGNIYTLHSKMYVAYDSSFKEVARGLVEDKWRYLPEKISAAIQDPESGAVFFFKWNNYWMYNGSEVRPNYPDFIFHGFPGVTVTSAVMYWRGDTYFFYHDTFIKYTSEPGPKEQKRTASYFNGVPSSLRGAIVMDNNTIYFFRKRSYYKYDAISNTTQRESLCKLIPPKC